jgi:hypothetical protein
MKYPILFILFLISTLSYAQTFSLGKFSIGESRIKLELRDFIIEHKEKDIKVDWDYNSIQWIRNEANLLSPRALIHITFPESLTNLQLKYLGKSIFPVKLNSNYESKVYVDLFNPEIIQIFSGTNKIDEIAIFAKVNKNELTKQFIDFSCSPYDLKIEGIDDEYISVGCKLNRLGSMGSETPRLEISLSSTNLKTLNNTPTPYIFYLDQNSTADIQLKNNKGEIKTLHFEAKVSKRLNRFKTALGFGPYIYQSQYQSAVQNSNLAPSLMLYGKFDLSETASFKLFDALLYSKTLFNNTGTYFSYDLAEMFDGRILINTLLGFQGIHYKYSPVSPTQFRLIYPQGIEVIYKHAFIENYNLFYGMFFSTSSEAYTNAWLRYGKRSFIEINYINWGSVDNKITMWGLSFGIPFFSAF